MRKLLWILLLVSVGLNIGLLVRSNRGSMIRPWQRDVACPLPGPGMGAEHPDPGHDGPGPDGPGRFQALGLSEDQHDRLRALREADRPLVAERREAMREVMTEMRALMAAEHLDRGRVTELRRRMALIRAEMDSLVADRLLDELEILEPAQRERYLRRMPWERFGRGMRDRNRH